LRLDFDQPDLVGHEAALPGQSVVQPGKDELGLAKALLHSCAVLLKNHLRFPLIGVPQQRRDLDQRHVEVA